jgi:hypothetical protein
MDNNVYLIECHSGVVDAPRILLPKDTILVTYGQIGDCNRSSEFENVYNAFFQNDIPMDETGILELIKPTPLNNKKLKIHDRLYHEHDITLCTYTYFNGDNSWVEDSEDAENVLIERSGVFQMGNNADIARRNSSITINKTYNKNATKGWFEITLRQAKQIYAGAIFPSQPQIEQIFGDKKVIRLDQFIEIINDMCPTLGMLFSMIGGGTFILSGCRSMDDIESIQERRLSSDGLRRERTIIPINTQSNTNKKVFRVPTIQKTKSRTSMIDSLANIGSQTTHKKSSRTNRGSDSLLTLKKGGRTKRNNQSKRKRTKRRRH